MTGTVFAAVLLAAALHATWNALVKGGGDKTASMAAVVLGQGAFGAALLPVVPVPLAASVPYLLVGLLLHLGYQIFLVRAYAAGDLTQVYPLARGSAPLLVALASAVFFGVTFDSVEILAIGTISAGILSISLVRRADGQFQGRGAALALITGVFIASYSLVDGQGARLAGTALGFYAWLSTANAVAFAAAARIMRPGLTRRALALRQHLLIGGGASFVAYALVVWAFTQAPIAIVTALRETSIIFALLIGVTFLKERLDLWKVISTFLTLSGAVLLRLHRN